MGQEATQRREHKKAQKSKGSLRGGRPEAHHTEEKDVTRDIS